MGFCSIPLKYPYRKMLVKTVLCKNRALPKLLRPKPWSNALHFLPILGKVAILIPSIEIYRKLEYIKSLSIIKTINKSFQNSNSTDTQHQLSYPRRYKPISFQIFAFHGAKQTFLETNSSMTLLFLIAKKPDTNNDRLFHMPL